MKKFVIAAVAAATLFGAQALANTTVNAFYGNTVETTSNGQTTRWHFDADGKLKAFLPDGATAPGTWALKDSKFCITVGAQPESCTAVTDGKAVGDTWNATNSAGQSFSVTIKAGR